MCLSKNATDQIKLTCQGTFMDQNLVYTYTGKDSIWNLPKKKLLNSTIFDIPVQHEAF